MIRKRIFTETLTSHPDGPHHPSQKSAMHDLGVTNITWVRIDDNTIVGHGEFPENVFSKMHTEGHDTAFMHSSLYETISLKDNIMKKQGGKHMTHLDSLTNYCGVKQTDTAADMMSKLLDAGFVFLAPDK